MSYDQHMPSARASVARALTAARVDDEDAEALARHISIDMMHERYAGFIQGGFAGLVVGLFVPVILTLIFG